ncbi:MAG: hypothetical protein QOF33_507, partial [Thermomicrobiales bacterium]|nr:hypothetical protein [Thermomicrobiales bacterium]
MDIRRFVDPTLDRSDGVSRREVLLGIGAGSLAAAMLAHGLESASAQEATPAAEGGLPPGVEIAPIIGSAPLDELPPAPAELHVYRLTIAPGVYF